MVFTLPADVDQRPVVIDGAGTLGRRIASVYAAGGSEVRIFDLSAEQREAARDYVEEHLAQAQQMLGLHPAQRGLNTHYQQPPELNAVELMSCGKTDEAVIEALMEKLPHYGLVPFWVRRESDGFIFNRIWAAIKRECLMVVEEGVASPEDVDAMWEIFTRAGVPPFRLMDRVGLDVVLAIEEHYAAVRDGIPEGPRKLLSE